MPREFVGSAAEAGFPGHGIGTPSTGIAAWRGREAEATALIQANMDGVASRGGGGA